MVEDSPRSALVVRGGWEGHQPKEATELFIPFLEAHNFAVRIEHTPDIYADAEYMQTVDLIVQCNTMATIDRLPLRGLRAAIQAGTGMAGWHGGIADSYRNSSDYLHLIGGQFACHPGKHPDECVGEQSDNYVHYRVNILPSASEHPITRGIADFDLVTEQYWVLSDDYIDVLATTTQTVREWDPWTRPVVSPAIWTRQWGKGRIFVCTPGHRVEVLKDPNVRTIIERGMLWASRRPSEIMSTAERQEPFLVRRLTDEDVESVGAILGLARLHQGNGFYLVAWENEEPLGHAYLALTDPPELQDVQVRPEQRRRGVATAMTSAAEEHARSLGHQRLRLEVSQTNMAAQALYRGRGFSDTGAAPRRVQGTIVIRTGPIEVDDTLLMWEKTLD